MPEGAFIRELEREMRGALEDSWFHFLRWVRMEYYGSDPREAEWRAVARERASAGEFPPWPEP